MAEPKLTPKEAKLVKGVVEGKTQAQAYIEAYDTKGNLPTVQVEASRTLNKPHVKEALELSMAKLNITPDRILKPIDDALNDDDVRVRLMGTDRALKVMSFGQRKEEAGNTFIFNKGDVVAKKYVKD